MIFLVGFLSFLSALQASDLRLAERLVQESFAQADQAFASEEKSEDLAPFQDPPALAETVSSNTCSAACSSKPLQKSFLENDHGKLWVAVSFSMPTPALKALAHQVHKVGGTLVLQGLVANSFQETRQKIDALGSPLEIDPRRFEQYHVTQVPTFVLSKTHKGGDYSDRVQGNMTLEAALELMAEHGDLRKEAQALLKKGRGQ